MNKHLELTEVEYMALKEAVCEYYHNTSKKIMKKGQENISPIAWKMHKAIEGFNDQFHGRN